MAAPSERDPVSRWAHRKWLSERGMALEILQLYVYIRREAFPFPKGVVSEQETVGA